MTDKKKMPGILTMAKNIAKDLGKYIKEGAPNVTNKEYTERLETCFSCPNLNKKHMRCVACGCLVEHKAKWKTTTCPDTPSRWKPLFVDPAKIKNQQIEQAKSINKKLHEGVEKGEWDPQKPETLAKFSKDNNLNLMTDDCKGCKKEKNKDNKKSKK